MRRALRPDGLLPRLPVAGDSLTELRQSWLAAEVLITGGVSPRVAPMIDMRELGALLQRAGFALPVADLDRTIVRYADAVALIHEIRDLGFPIILRAARANPSRAELWRRPSITISRISPTRTAASAPRSKWPGSPAGHRMKASSNP